MNLKDPETFMKRRRLIMLLVSVSLFVQIFLLLAYYFKEKQVVLTFPMVVGIFFTAMALLHLKQLKL